MKKQNPFYTISLLLAMVTTGTFLLVQTYTILGTGLINTARQAAPFINHVTY